MGFYSKGPKKELETAVIKKPSVFKPIEVLLYIIGGPKEDTVKPILSKHLWDKSKYACLKQVLA